MYNLIECERVRVQLDWTASKWPHTHWDFFLADRVYRNDARFYEYKTFEICDLTDKMKHVSLSRPFLRKKFTLSLLIWHLPRESIFWLGKKASSRPPSRFPNNHQSISHSFHGWADVDMKLQNFNRFLHEGVVINHV